MSPLGKGKYECIVYKTGIYNKGPNDNNNINNNNVDFVVPADHNVKLKEKEKKDKHFDLARKSKTLWNMKVTVIPIVNGILFIVDKGLILRLEDLEIRERVETIQTSVPSADTAIWEIDM